jgi:hypothetical protein
MPWDDDTSSTTCGPIYGATSGRVYYSNTAITSGTTATVITYGATSGAVTYLGTMSNITGATGFAIWPMGITSVAGYTANAVGFAADQVRAIRSDFDQVKKSWKRKRAEVKARRLFHKIVGTIRYKRFRELGYHEIVGPSGRRYRLAPGQWIKVFEKDSDKIDHLLCAHLEIGIPWFDNMIVQHLMLTSNKESEKQFLKLANVHGVDGPYPIPELRVAS